MEKRLITDVGKVALPMLQHCLLNLGNFVAESLKMFCFCFH